MNDWLTRMMNKKEGGRRREEIKKYLNGEEE